ncbi:MAG: dimethyl sulfoxide reductase anchor subunit [Paracoccaceae bacterium]|nr:dimethyl sulfoxide reductase anchor subunit [Paracoccaceae bacterium]
MHPAPSIILFTVVSGMGFGLLFFLCLGFPAVSGWTAFVWFFAAYALAVGGLALSAFHLGQPRRALRAFTQWRSSWLSREAVLSVATLCLCGLQALLLIFRADGHPLLGGLAALFCLGSVFCTSMIYASLRTVPRWNHPVTPLVFCLTSLGGGAIMTGVPVLATPLLILLTAAQLGAWWIGDRRFADAGSTVETATGLAAALVGTRTTATAGATRVRLLEPPHTGESYLTREMVFIVGRRHATKLRILSLVCLVILPLCLLALPAAGPEVTIPAVAAHAVGAIVSRWLFFAEAEHVVGLYYGRR